jgi:hypothetical protein
MCLQLDKPNVQLCFVLGHELRREKQENNRTESTMDDAEWVLLRLREMSGRSLERRASSAGLRVAGNCGDYSARLGLVSQTQKELRLPPPVPGSTTYSRWHISANLARNQKFNLQHVGLCFGKSVSQAFQTKFIAFCGNESGH